MISLTFAAQRRPGREPRRHAPLAARAASTAAVLTAQRRPGREPRRHPGAGPGPTRSGTLNEGRGANPGDTRDTPARELAGCARSTKAGARTPATPARRRPGGQQIPRSTKAGARTPATPASPGPRPTTRSSLNEGRGANPGDTIAEAYSLSPHDAAQRRPGREPRRHSIICVRSVTHERSLNEGRGANPGDTRTTGGWCWSTGPLNEGRGANPGDTFPRGNARAWVKGAQLVEGAVAVRHRSTKAGARTPATPTERRPSRHRPWPLNEGRGANPGDTRNGADGPRGLLRSTKAGARTPATRPKPECLLSARPSLNEGRGANPGDTGSAGEDDGAQAIAQRRPGREPRRHHRSRRRAWPSSSAQRRPGREPRRHPPAASPASSRLDDAQRRPGREPRRHARGPPGSRCRRGPLNEGRGANPGDTARARPSVGRRRPLNEGRGANPGDTSRVARSSALAPEGAQRRPGREPRRHASGRRRCRCPGCTLNEGRGANPGDTRCAWVSRVRPAWCAQRRPGREPRRHADGGRDTHVANDALNEGRGANPGDTRGRGADRAGDRGPLNEGRGANPGDTRPGAWVPGRLGCRSTKAGARTPATRR